MLRTPSSRRKVKADDKLNLNPILDAVFIFIFFLVVSTSFIKVYEIPSMVPTLSDKEPPKPKKPPLNLTLKIFKGEAKLYKGVPLRLIKTFSRQEEGFNTLAIHEELIALKQTRPEERNIILEPSNTVIYEDIVKIMDAVRVLEKTDPSFYIKDKDGMDEKVEQLFDKIVFSNIQS